MTIRQWLVLGAAALLTACSSRTDAPTYFEDVEPILQRRCQSCHVAGGIAPFALTDLDGIRARAQLSTAAVLDGRMPPWPPSRRGLPLRFDRSLTSDEIRTVASWVQSGMPQGRPENHREVHPELVTIRGDVELRMPARFTPSASTKDDYRCFLIDPGFDRDRHVTGYNVLPGLRAMVHHVLLYVVTDASQIASLARLDGSDGAPGYSCIGGASGDDGDGEGDKLRLFGGWEPGAVAVELPSGTGVRVPRGARFVMQVHYTTENVRAADLTVTQLQLDGDGAIRDGLLWPLRNDRFLVPAGARSFLVEQTQVVGDASLPPATLYNLFPHMHLFGTSISISLVRGGRETTLLEIPRWAFGWQGDYSLATPVALRAGDALHLRCTYDNSPEHQPIVDGKRQQPRELRWGERALDEMCLANLFLVP